MSHPARILLPLAVVWLVIGCGYRGPKQYIDFVAAGSTAAAPAAVTQAADALQVRLRSVQGTNVSVQGDRIRVGVPANEDRKRIIAICTKHGELTFVLMPKHLAMVAGNHELWEDQRAGKQLTAAEALKAGTRAFDGRDLAPKSAVIPSDRPNEFGVRFEFRRDRRNAFKTFTAKHVASTLAIALDDEILMAPVIKSPVPGTGVISGGFDAQEAADLRDLINSGPLPMDLRVDEPGKGGATQTDSGQT